MGADTPSQRKIQWKPCDSLFEGPLNTFLCLKDSYALLGWNMYGRSNMCRGWVCTLTSQRGGLCQLLSYCLSAPLPPPTLSSRMPGLVLWKPVLLVGSLLGSPAGGTKGRLQSLGEKELAPWCQLPTCFLVPSITSRKSTLNIHWKDSCWWWSSNSLTS